MAPDAWVRDVEAILSRTIGLEVASIGPAALHESIGSAYRDSGFDDPRAFVAAVERDSQTRQALIARVVVPETWFLRDRAPFELLQRHAALWARTHPAGVLRVLSAPCATGEEPYSIAITLLEAGLAAERFAIDAVDVSESLLERARRGVYHSVAFRQCPPAVQARFFSAGDGGLRLDPAVLSAVRFDRRSLTEPNASLPSARYDVIFCRNLLIYLHRDARRELLRLLGDSLTAGGLLIVGHSEVIPTCDGGGFSVADSRAFALVRATPPSPTAKTVPVRTVPVRTVPVRTVTPPAHLPAIPPVRPSTLRRAASDAARSAAAPAVASEDHAAEADPLARARLLADQGLLVEAQRECERLMASHGPSDRIYCLLGVISQAAGRHQEGADALRKALYLNPGNRDALLQLAVTQERRGDRPGAERLRRRAARAPEATPAPETGRRRE